MDLYGALPHTPPRTLLKKGSWNSQNFIKRAANTCRPLFFSYIKGAYGILPYNTVLLCNSESYPTTTVGTAKEDEDERSGLRSKLRREGEENFGV